MNKFKKILPAVVILASFFAGYYVSSLQQSKQTLRKERIERKIIEHKLEIGERNASELEQKLKEVRQHEQNIIEDANKNSSEKLGNNTDCNSFDDDFIELFNRQRAEYERILSSEHDASVP